MVFTWNRTMWMRNTHTNSCITEECSAAHTWKTTCVKWGLSYGRVGIIDKSYAGASFCVTFLHCPYLLACSPYSYSYALPGLFLSKWMPLFHSLSETLLTLEVLCGHVYSHSNCSPRTSALPSMLHSHTSKQHFRITFSELQSTDQLSNYLLTSQKGLCSLELYISSEMSNISVNFYSVCFLVYCVTWLLNKSWKIFVIVQHDVEKWRTLIMAKKISVLRLE
jgi:hypothetical protein